MHEAYIREYSRSENSISPADRFPFFLAEVSRPSPALTSGSMLFANISLAISPRRLLCTFRENPRLLRGKNRRVTQRAQARQWPFCFANLPANTYGRNSRNWDAPWVFIHDNVSRSVLRCTCFGIWLISCTWLITSEIKRLLIKVIAWILREIFISMLIKFVVEYSNLDYHWNTHANVYWNTYLSTCSRRHLNTWVITWIRC